MSLRVDPIVMAFTLKKIYTKFFPLRVDSIVNNGKNGNDGVAFHEIIAFTSGRSKLAYRYFCRIFN